MRLVRLATLGILALVTSSCFLPGGRSDDDVEPREARTRDLTLYVQNQNFYDANLYAVHNGYRERLGFVGGLSDERFTFRWNQLDLRIDIQFVSAGSYLTEFLLVDEGDVLELRIDPSLHLRTRRP